MGLYYSIRRSKIERIALKRRLVDMLGGKCVDCGYNQHLAALDFDHKEPQFKSFAIATGLNKHSDNLVIMEAHKCELRCANCHRVKTHPEYGKEPGVSSKGDNDNGFE